MKEYIVTFHTHFSAILTRRNMDSRGVELNMEPVPRALSSSCGTCIRYRSESDCAELIDKDFEAVYLVRADNEYEKIREGQD